MVDTRGWRSMSAGGRPSMGKRQKEQARKERKKQKARRLAERRADRADAPEDPLDVSGIVAGPQPVPSDDEND